MKLLRAAIVQHDAWNNYTYNNISLIGSGLAFIAAGCEFTCLPDTLNPKYFVLKIKYKGYRWHSNSRRDMDELSLKVPTLEYLASLNGRAWNS